MQLALMRQTLEEFRGFVSKNIISQITRLDLLRYRQWLIDHKRTDRTASNKMLRVGQFLRAVLKLKPGEGLVTERDGKYEEKEPEVYTDDELKKFFEHCNPFQYAAFKTYLMSGFRRKELENLTWDCVDLKAGTLRVEAKGDFVPKTWQQRGFWVGSLRVCPAALESPLVSRCPFLPKRWDCARQ
jgi:integrase